MKKLILLITVLCCNFYFALSEQVLIYKTYDDYKKNTPTTLDGDIDGFPDVNNSMQYNSGITVKTSEKKERLFCADFWGFKYKEVLFRNFKFNLKYTKDGKTSYGFMALVSQGKVCYWENGIAALEVLSSNKEKKKGTLEGLSCNGKFGLSKTIESDIITGRFNGFINSNKEYSNIPSEFKEASMKNDVCPNGIKKEGGLKTADKLFDLGGINDLAFLNYAAGVNNNAGKPMGISAAIYLSNLEMKHIRDFFKAYNSGNFNSIIFDSEYR